MTDKRLWELIRFQIEQQIYPIGADNIKDRAELAIADIKNILKQEGYSIIKDKK